MTVKSRDMTVCVEYSPRHDLWPPVRGYTKITLTKNEPKKTDQPESMFLL